MPDAPRHDLANAGAVPHTGRGWNGHYFRRPRSIAVKRGLLAVYNTLRGVPTPPDAWDDGRIAARADRSWKRHRKNRWRTPR